MLFFRGTRLRIKITQKLRLLYQFYQASILLKVLFTNIQELSEIKCFFDY